MKLKLERFAILLTLASIVAFSWLKPLDATAKSQIDEGFNRAVASFAVARVLNGVISVAQGTEISFSLGVGATLTPGQILDPVNDLVEQFSELMLIASVAFGIMKILLSIGSFWVFSAILSGVALVWALLKLNGRLPPILLTKILLMLIFVRFSVPLVAVGNDLVYKRFLAKDFNESQLAIENSKAKLASFSPPINPSPAANASPQTVAPQPAQSNGIWDRTKVAITSAQQAVGNMYEQAKQKYDPAPYIENLKEQANNLVDHIIKLIVVFVLQTIVIPLILMWALYRSFLALSDSAGRTRGAMSGKT